MENKKVEGIEPWYRLVRSGGLYKTPSIPRFEPSLGLLAKLEEELDPEIKAEKRKLLFAKINPPAYATGGEIFEYIYCILVNPLRNISIAGKDRDILYRASSGEFRLYDEPFSIGEKALVRAFYENPNSEELTVKYKELYLDRIRQKDTYIVLKDIPDNFNLLSEGNDRHNVPGVRPFPLLLALKKDHETWELRDRDRRGGDYFHRETSIGETLDERVVEFVGEFMEENIMWLISKGATDLYHWMDFCYLDRFGNKDGTALLTKVMDTLIANGAR